LSDQLRGQLRDYFAGALWCAWEVFYAFGRKIGVTYKPEHVKKLGLWIEQSRQCHWWFPYRGLVLASERPTVLSVNAQGRLHSAEGQAIGYSDGWGFHYLNGISMEPWMVTTPHGQLDAKKILGVPNVDQRRELIRRIGIERLVDHLPHKSLDKKGDYELLAIDLSDELKACRYLKMLNPSVPGVWHLEGVSNDCKTVQHALNWRRYKDITQEWQPAQLT
jgi:hypothetical protein